MKKLILILLILAFGLTGFSQTLIRTDTLISLSGADTTFEYYYHTEFSDKDMPFVMINIAGKVTVHKNADTTTTSVMTFKSWNLRENDSVYNPFNSTWYSYSYVKAFLYNNGEEMKRTLTGWRVENWIEKHTR